MNSPSASAPIGDGPQLRTFGCRLNIAESERMRDLAAAHGLHDAVIVNSCAVTLEAERQTAQAIRRAHREGPDTPIIVTGCAATLEPAKFRAMAGVSHVLENGVKLDPVRWASLGGGDLRPAPPPNPLPPERGRVGVGVFPRTRGFVQIQQGCDHRCTFCVIPHARGPNRSVPTAEVIDAVRRFVDAGHQEIVLTGVDITAWGSDLDGQPTLGVLVEHILAAVPELPRLRLSSLDSAEIDPPLWSLIAHEPRLMPHLHLSVQSGDDLVLKQMRRRHSRAQLIEVAQRAKEARPELALGADFIVGFPTESEAQFQRTLDLVEAASLDYLHVFSYSARPLTPAAKLPPLPPAIVQDRSRQLRQLAQQRLTSRLNSLVGQTKQVLIEQGGTGHTECFARVQPSRPVTPGALVTVRIDRVADQTLIGDVL